MGRVLLHGRCDSFGRCTGPAAPNYPFGIVDDADRRLLQGHIKANILVSLRHGLAPLALRGDQPAPAVVTPRLRLVPARTMRQLTFLRLAARTRPPYPNAHPVPCPSRLFRACATRFPA